jgi:hypothetical protein
MMRKRASRRRIKKRFLLGKWVAKFDIVNRDLGKWIAAHQYEVHELMDAVRKA